MSHQTVRPSKLRIKVAKWRDVTFGWFAGLLATLQVWIVRRRGRQALQDLADRGDEHLLADIGATREEALHKAAKWFWQP